MRRLLPTCGSFLLLALATAPLGAQTPDSTDVLHREFLDPPRDFSPMPFWFWNGEMKGPIIQQEIRDEAGHSFYITDSVDALIATLDAKVPKDVRVTFGPAQHLLFEHRVKQHADYYWVVNDSGRKRINQVHFAVKGIPEKWNALTGAREPLFYTNDASGTNVRLDLYPWDAFYVVFLPFNGSTQEAVLEATNADELDHITHHADTFGAHVTGPASSSGIFVELRSGPHLYRAESIASASQPLLLQGLWQFHPQPDRISVPYARVNLASSPLGDSLGWAAAGFDDTNWPEAWLSEEQTTVQQWQLIGPFPNNDNDGFAKAYPPEQEFDPQKKYDGLTGPVGWEDYDGNEPHLALEDWGILMKTEGGRSSDSSYIINFNAGELTNDLSWITSYAHTYLYSPVDQRAQFVVAADNWARIWLNHREVFGQLRTPFWYELNDNWADRILVDLHKGWNEVLVKVGKARGTPSEFFGLTFRVTDAQESTLANVIAATSPRDLDQPLEESIAMRWYRVRVPPGCVAVVPPCLRRPDRMMLSGRALSSAGGAPINIRPLLRGEDNTLVLVAHQDDPILAPIVFVTGATPFALKSWTQTGLANFSGTAIYTRTFTLPASLRDKRLMLDLGRVSSVAQVFVNGASAGTLIWSPYRVDITKLVKPGVNEIKVLVTNTEANQRAVGTSRHILSSIDLNGLEGPVQIIPYVDQVLTLRPVSIHNIDPAQQSTQRTSDK